MPKAYPCTRCGVERTKGHGGTIFTVCDACWGRAGQPRVDKNDDNPQDWAPRDYLDRLARGTLTSAGQRELAEMFSDIIRRSVREVLDRDRWACGSLESGHERKLLENDIVSAAIDAAREKGLGR